MNEENLKQCIAFRGSRRIAMGDMATTALKVKQVIDTEENESIVIFDAQTSQVVEMDFRGTVNDVLKRLERPTDGDGSLPDPGVEDRKGPRGPGRPKLGVVSREVTLLPRHWEWLNIQPGGASVTLRKLVEEAKRKNSGRDKVRHSQEAAYRFMSAMAGNLPGFEEAARALFAGDPKRFDSLVASWPVDIRDHARTLAHVALHSRAAEAAP